MKLFTAALASAFFGISCGKANVESALDSSHAGDASKSASGVSSSLSASCFVTSQKGNSLITEKASFEVKDAHQFKLVYTFTVETQGEKKLGRQEITGVLDRDFNSVFEPRLTYFLLSSGEFKSHFDAKVTERHLAKTEVLLKNGRLIVEEHDIILDLKSCQVH
ncbi:MAG: hypothetical protein WCI18_00975 [Pseudomonadota bacterium]